MNLPPAEPDEPVAPTGVGAADDDPERLLEAARKRARLERIFGSEPLSTRDDLPDPEPGRSADDWYRDNKPPHHG